MNLANAQISNPLTKSQEFKGLQSISLSLILFMFFYPTTAIMLIWWKINMGNSYWFWWYGSSSKRWYLFKWYYNSLLSLHDLIELYIVFHLYFYLITSFGQFGFGSCFLTSTNSGQFGLASYFLIIIGIFFSKLITFRYFLVWMTISI